MTIDPRAREELRIRQGDRVSWVKNREGRWELWTDAEFDRAWEEASVGLEEFLRRSRKGWGRRLRDLEGR